MNGKMIEEFGFKAAKKGFFKQWQHLSISLKNKDAISFEKASEVAYHQLLIKE